MEHGFGKNRSNKALAELKADSKKSALHNWLAKHGSVTARDALRAHVAGANATEARGMLEALVKAGLVERATGKNARGRRVIRYRTLHPADDQLTDIQRRWLERRRWEAAYQRPK